MPEWHCDNNNRYFLCSNEQLNDKIYTHKISRNKESWLQPRNIYLIFLQFLPYDELCLEIIIGFLYTNAQLSWFKSKILLKLKYIYILCPKHNANNDTIQIGVCLGESQEAGALRMRQKINPTSLPKSKKLFPPLPTTRKPLSSLLS